jgi:hypothetical protein
MDYFDSSSYEPSERFTDIVQDSSNGPAFTGGIRPGIIPR